MTLTGKPRHMARHLFRAKLEKSDARFRERDGARSPAFSGNLANHVLRVGTADCSNLAVRHNIQGEKPRLVAAIFSKKVLYKVYLSRAKYRMSSHQAPRRISLECTPASRQPLICRCLLLISPGGEKSFKSDSQNAQENSPFARRPKRRNKAETNKTMKIKRAHLYAHWTWK
jgi:hypothetical protein